LNNILTSLFSNNIAFLCAVASLLKLLIMLSIMPISQKIKYLDYKKVLNRA
jgi:hypothetical protein